MKKRYFCKRSIKKVYNESVKGNGIIGSNGWTGNIAGFKIYAFTLDYYNEKTSWTGSYWNDIRDCYFFEGRAVEKYAIDLHGNVYNLEKKLQLLNFKI